MCRPEQGLEHGLPQCALLLPHLPIGAEFVGQVIARRGCYLGRGTEGRPHHLFRQGMGAIAGDSSQEDQTVKFVQFERVHDQISGLLSDGFRQPFGFCWLTYR